MTQETTEQQNSSSVIATPAEITDFKVGDTVVVHYRITEGNKTRTQPYEGIVISKKGEGMSKTFMVRKIGADSVGVERIFPLYSPNIEKLEVKRRGKVRRAKLFYLRDKKGRAATRVKELKNNKTDNKTANKVQANKTNSKESKQKDEE